MNALHIQDHASDAVSGWAGWALAPPEFRSSVHPFLTRRADYAQPYYCLLLEKSNDISVVVRYSASIYIGDKKTPQVHKLLYNSW